MPEDLKEVSDNPVQLSDLQQVAEELLICGKGLQVWFLIGEMGAGKTTLAKQIVKQFGLTQATASPTFSIVNEYGSGDKLIYHIDLFRLKNENEALEIGIDEYLKSGHLCLIEWPVKIKTLWPDQFFEVVIEHNSTLSRKIYYKRHD
jgi:tRNA threonylcarbamoyladenosine biosynthesis protein TsaE